MADLRNPIPQTKQALLKIRCFGNFDVFDASGTLIKFHRTKSKELLAYLVYLRGSSCTIREISAVLFEDAVYDNKKKNYIQNIISSMIKKRCGGGG